MKLLKNINLLNIKIQQELQMRQGALKTLQELVNKSAQEQVSSDTDSAPVTSIGSAAENVEMEDVAWIYISSYSNSSHLSW